MPVKAPQTKQPIFSKDKVLLAMSVELEKVLIESGGMHFFTGNGFDVQVADGVEATLVFFAESNIDEKIEWNVHLGKESTAKVIGMHLNRAQVQASLTVKGGAKSEVETQLLVIGNGESKCSWRATNHSVASGAQMELTTTTILKDKAFGQVQGLPLVPLGIYGCANHLSQHVLHLGERCRSYQVPLLVIANNEVQASHSCSMARLDAEDLFYCQSKGLDQKTAEGLLTEGLVMNVVGQISDDEKRDVTAEKLLGAL